jgi:pyruvate dehydrogenase E1 component
MRIRDGHEWDEFEGLEAREAELPRSSPACPSPRRLRPRARALPRPAVHVPAAFPAPRVAEGRKLSTQQAFGEILAEIGRGHGEAAALSQRIVTTSPDVTVSTNLGPG